MWASSLKYLHIDGNNFFDIPKSAVALRECSYTFRLVLFLFVKSGTHDAACLKELTASRNPISSLPNAQFWQCRRLDHLDLSDCHLENSKEIGKDKSSE